MDQGPGPSRLGEVIQPFLLVGVLVATASGAALALTYDAPPASKMIQVAFLLLFVPSILLIGPYLATIGSQGLGLSRPLMGVPAAALGCAGFAAMIGLAVARPVEPTEGWAGLAVGLGFLVAHGWKRSRAGRAP
jgi:hypothetical protein